MEKLQFKITINASKQKVWETMLNDETYRQWTDVFNPDNGSYFEGDWSEGRVMKFLGTDPSGDFSGMYSLVKESRPYDFISIQHLGEIIKGEEKPWDPSMFDGQEFHENYTFNETDGKTEVIVDLDSNEQFKEMFEGMWPKGLEKLKELAEK